MQLDMLQEDLFSDSQETPQSASSGNPVSSSKSSPKPPAGASHSGPYKQIDLTTAQITPVRKAAEAKDTPPPAKVPSEAEVKNAVTPPPAKQGPVLVEQEMPSTATLLDEDPKDPNPIGNVLPVLGKTQTPPPVIAQKLPVLESASHEEDADEQDMADDVYDRDADDDADMTDEDVAVAAETEDNGKAPGAFKTISEAAGFLGVPQHVLRFWESRFSQIKPLKMRGGRRYYRPEDMEVLSTIKHLLYKQGYTIKGAKKVFSTRNREALDAAQRDVASTAPVAAKKAAPKMTEKPAFDERKKKQLSTIRNELLGLRETLSGYLS